MKRSDILRATPALMLAACGGGGAASRLLVPSSAQSLSKPPPPFAFSIGPYNFQGPEWIYGRDNGYGYLIYYNEALGPNYKTEKCVGYMAAFQWWPDNSSATKPGVRIEFGWKCSGTSLPPTNCQDVWTLKFATDPKDLQDWLPGQVRQIFDKAFHIGVGIPDGAPGGTLRDAYGNKLFTIFKQKETAYVTQYNPYGYTECAWPSGYGTGSGPDVSEQCMKGICTFIGGLATGIAGAVTTEVLVGWLGVIAGGAAMISGAIDIKGGCK